MDESQEEYVQLLQRAKSDTGFFFALSKVVDDMGLDYCSYGMRMPLPVSQPRIIMLGNQMHLWQKTYFENYHHNENVLTHDIHPFEPFIWSQTECTGCEKLWEDALSQGLQCGWMQYTYDAKGIVGMLTLASSRAIMSLREMYELALKKSWLTMTAHTSASRLFVPKLMPESQTQLTAREVQVLRWSADGKTSCEISDIMAISERTVNFHINNALVKLEASNRISGVIKASILGFL